MRFGPVAPAEAEGAILAHSVPLAKGRLRKGRRITAADCDALTKAGHAEVWVARPEAGDVPEDEAATRLAAALVPDPQAVGLRIGRAATGRVNLHADRRGVLCYSAEAIHALNGADPGLTFALLEPVARVREGQLVGTVKMIPYAVPGDALATAEAAARDASLLVRQASIERATLIETEVPGIAAGTKGERAVRGRVEALGAALDPVVRTLHRVEDIAAAIAASDAGLVLILTASATSDPHDVAPEAVRRAGGRLIRFGMPVDPGNLLFVGEHGGRPVIGLPGCARSPALNGADWVLDRILTGLPCGSGEIARMGVGGLLKETSARGLPREPIA